jgi:hypothetical protein
MVDARLPDPALAESRKAFDQANRAAWDALKRVTPPKT